MRHLSKGLLLLFLLAPLAAGAQGRGRTDGPEGSEIGKGGYDDPFGGTFSLQVDWGAALTDDPGVDGAPLFLGLTGSWWYDDWIQVDLSGHYVFDTEDLTFLVGPRFRSSFHPLSVWLGVKAGALIRAVDTTFFALSPQAGADVRVTDHFLMGLAYALDIPLGDSHVTHRVYLSLGWRF